MIPARARGLGAMMWRVSTTRESRAPSVSPQSGAVGGPRIVVPDVLRGVAILAMLIAHAVPLLLGAPSAVNFMTDNVNDVASPLFALVMGMSAQIVTQRTARADAGGCCSSRS